MRRAGRAGLGLLTVAALLCLANADRVRGIPPPWTAALVVSAAWLGAVWLERRRRGSRLLDAPAHWPLFFVCLTAYLATLRWHGGDDIPNSLIPFGLLRHGTLSLEPFRAKFQSETLADFVVPGSRPLLSMFSPVPALLALPVFLLPALAGPHPNDFGLHNLSKVSGSLITAASVAVVYQACRRARGGRGDGRWEALCALFYGLGTWSFSISSQALHSHGPADLGVAVGLLGLLGGSAWDAALAGLGFALAFSSREGSVFFLAAAGLYFLAHERRRLPSFLAGAAPPLLFDAAYWLWASGRLLPPYMGVQGGMFTGLQPAALWAMLASPTRGLLFFCPAALFGLAALAARWRDPARRWGPYQLAGCAAFLIFISTRTSWTGGQTFGTRYLAPVATLAAVGLADLAEAAAASRALAAAWAAAFAASIVVQGLGAAFPYPGSFVLETQIAQLWDWRLHPAANLFTAAGPLGTLPEGPRALAASILLAAVLPLAAWCYRQTLAGSSLRPSAARPRQTAT